MKIVSIDTLHADGGIRTCSYVKVVTDEGLIGWSEYYDQYSGAVLAPLIQSFASKAIGRDPMAIGMLSEALARMTYIGDGGLARQAIAAIVNACFDIKGKALGVPVHALFGGPFRREIPVYWTHCGSFRVRFADFYERVLGMEPVRTLDDFVRLGREAVEAGFAGVKTNPVLFAGKRPVMLGSGFAIGNQYPSLSLDDTTISNIADQITALQQGGTGLSVMLDVSFSQRTESYIRLARRLAPLRLGWLEMDLQDPEALALVRASSETPIASLETIHGLARYQPYLARRSVDVAIVDVMWNGFWDAFRICSLADAFDTPVALHNPVGELGTLISAHLCAAVPNIRVLEYRPDEAPWTRDFVTHRASVREGILSIPDRPGWGADVVEEALRAHPVQPGR